MLFKKKLILFFSLGFLFLLVLPVFSLVSAITIQTGTVFNTSVSNSSMTFSVEVNATNVTIYSNAIYLENISVSGRTCASHNHSEENINFDSSNTTLCPSSSSSDSSSSGGGGSGGSSSFWSGTTFTITNEQFEQSYTKLLKFKQRIKIIVDKQSHYLGVKKIKSGSAIIEISSDPITLELVAGENAKVDLTNNGYYDLYIVLNGIESNAANITIQELHEEIPEGEGPVTTTGDIVTEEEEVVEEEFVWWKFVAPIIIILIIILVWIFTRKKKKK